MPKLVRFARSDVPTPEACIRTSESASVTARVYATTTRLRSKPKIAFTFILPPSLILALLSYEHVVVSAAEAERLAMNTPLPVAQI